MIREKLQKIDDYTWLLPKTAREGMRVDAKIFGTKKIIDLCEEQAFAQLTNVACLPGVVEPVCGMPDIHWGYGLPVGAVGVFDKEEGIISAGMTGFDINCLDGSSKVLHEFGYRKSIKDFEKTFTNDRIKCLNPTTKVKDTGIKYFMKIPTKKRVFNVETETGEIITATEDHPFFTKQGMKRLKELSGGDEVSIYPFEGVEYKEPDEATIISEKDIKNQLHIKELKKRGLLPLKYNNQKLPYLIKIIGFATGDGHAYSWNGRGSITFYSKEPADLESIKKDIEQIGYKAVSFSRKRSHTINTNYGIVKFKATEGSLRCGANSLYSLLEVMGVPIGNKTTKKFLVPNWLLKAPLWHKRLYLASLFGAELSSPKTVTKHGYNFYGPVLSLNKIEGLTENCEEFLLQIKDILSEFEVKSRLIRMRKEYEGKNGISYRLRLQISSRPQNLVKLWSKIGFEYNNKRRFKANVAIQYLKLKNKIINEREKAIEKTIKLREAGVTRKDIFKEIKSDYINKRFIIRTLYEKRTKPRVALNFMKFEDFLEKNTKGLGRTGQAWSRITKKEETPFNDLVYDFTVHDEHHNFIANNFVVSNCGIHMLKTNLTSDDIERVKKQLTDELFKAVPSGVGSKSKIRLGEKELNEIMIKGANWCVENGYGVEDDVKRMEEEGNMLGGDVSKVSAEAKKRGTPQLGTLGAGNHFLEVQKVEELFDNKTAKNFGLEKDGVTVMIHCGSRGFGHQIASDYLRTMKRASQKYNIWLPDPQLVCAPFKSEEGQDYYKAMICGVNYAFANRQMISAFARTAFEKVFKTDWQSLGMDTLYDVCHNIAKLEKHKINGKMKEVVVHRKGATRAFAPKHEKIPMVYRNAGQPVLIAGSMGTSSYILVGTKDGMAKSFGSSCHGAGRAMSRHSAIKKFQGANIQSELENKGIFVKATNPKLLAEEAPNAYKDVDEVIKSVRGAGISGMVAKVVPMIVTKG